MACTARIPKAPLIGTDGIVMRRMSQKMFGEVAWNHRMVLNPRVAIRRTSQR